MALQASTVWEVRTDGSDNNGGGYSSGGSDYSQQPTAQLNPTDLAQTQSSTTLTSAVGGFTSPMQGNIIQITAGTNFDVGFYEITVYTDPNTVTIDRTAASGGNGSGGTGYVGGALLTIAQALSVMVSGNDIYVRGGTYSVSASLSSSTNGVNGNNPNRLIGYSSGRGDNGKPIIQRSANAFDMISITGDDWHIENFELDGVDICTRGIKYATGNRLSVARILAHRFITYGIEMTGGGIVQALDCRVTDMASGATGALYGLGIAQFYFCVAHDNPCLGFDMYGGACHGCIADTNTGGSSDGFQLRGTSNNGSIVNCVAYNNDRDGIRITTTYSAHPIIFNNILTDNAGYGLNFSAGSAANRFYDYNAFYNNTTGLRNNVSAGSNDVTLTGDPFNDAANRDFTLNKTADAGAACRGAGFPGALI